MSAISEINLKSFVDQLSESLRVTVNAVEKIEVSPPTNAEGVYSMIGVVQEYLLKSTDDLYTMINNAGNVLEDYIRTVYIYLDDATLEGHATELETQLGQLRLMGEAVKSLPNDYNDEMADVLGKYFGMVNSIVDIQASSGKLASFDRTGDWALNHLTGVTKLSLLDSSYIKTIETLKTFKESCVKILSILAMTIGRWETKLEDRVDTEHISEGMVMSNMERGKSMSSKNKKKKNKDSSFYN